MLGSVRLRMMGWTPTALCAASWCHTRVYGGLERIERKESEMNATTVAVDLAKSVFQVAVIELAGVRRWRSRAT